LSTALSDDASHFSATESIRDNRRLEIRALRPEDRDEMLAAVGRMSAEARYLRFFAPKRSFDEQELDYYLNVDFVQHVALVAVLEQDGRHVIVGGARYIITAPGRAEIAFSVDDDHRGMGIASALMRHLVKIAQAAGVTELFAEVLPENTAMRAVFARSGLPLRQRNEDGVVHVAIALSGRGR
jgi:RimJ/RimL family protein N-acetyltransferase